MDVNEITLYDIEDLFSRMNSDVDVAVVEGKRDRRALRENGFQKPIIECSSMSGFEVVQEILDMNAQTAVVLTDFDEHGRKLFSEISKGLEMRGIKLKSIYRKKIKEILDTRNMKTIESLYNLRNKLDDSYGKRKGREKERRSQNS